MNYARLTDSPADAVAAALSGTARGIAAPTSGSTGVPREVLLSASAVRASATATLARLGGGAHWLLAVPATRIAGAMVLARASVGGGAVTPMREGAFTAAAFAQAVAGMPTGRRYVSLVPTQVRRLLADARGADALATFDAVLVGGAAPGMALPAGAVETYGMTETCGGCVYDGAPLDGVDVRVDDDGRVLLAGPMLADGYADGDDSAFVRRDGHRWLRTGDLGAWDGSRLVIAGRADDVIITGGVNVHPAAVERALLALPDIADAVVVGVPDPEWGQVVAALVVTGPDVPVDAADVRAALPVSRAERPRIVLAVDAVPRTDAGKIDRSAARTLAARAAKEAP